MDQKSKIENIFHCPLSVFHFQWSRLFPQIKIPEGLKMFTLHHNFRELLKKTFFQLLHGLLLKYKMVTQITRNND